MIRLDLLKEAVELIETLEDNQFNISIIRCGSAGCFIGWGGTLESWQKIGIKSNEYDFFNSKSGR